MLYGERLPAPPKQSVTFKCLDIAMRVTITMEYSVGSALRRLMCVQSVAVQSLLALSRRRRLEVLEDALHAADARDVVPGVVIAASLTLGQS